MASKYVLDTHALIWYLEGNALLGSKAREVIDDSSSELVLPIIALAEAMFVVEKGRTAITSVTELLNDVRNDARIDVVPLTENILDASLSLSSIPEIHDRLIVATGTYLESLGDTVEIVTKDRDITGSGILNIVW